MRSIAQVISLKKDAKEKIIKFLCLRPTICVSEVNSLCNSEASKSLSMCKYCIKEYVASMVSVH